MIEANLLLEVLSTMAEHERISIKERQAEGISILRSKNNGKGIGRPKAEYPNNFKEVYKEWKDTKITGVKAMELLNLKKNTFYKLIKEYEESK